MQPLQIVLPTGGQHRLTTVDNPDSLPPDAVERSNNGAVVPRLGTDGLLSLAVAAVQDGLRVTFLDLRDTRFQPIDDDLDDIYQEVLLRTIRSGNLQEVRKAANGKVRNVYVVGIEIALENKERFRIGRNGAVFAGPLARATLNNILTQLWRRMDVL